MCNGQCDAPHPTPAKTEAASIASLLHGAFLSGLCRLPHCPAATLRGSLLCCLPACLPSMDPCTLPPRIKKPRWWPLLSHLSAFNISPRLPIVCDSPVLLPSFGSPHSPEISFSHSPARVPQGWVACHCLLLSILFLVPSLKKLSKHHHTRPCCAPKLLLAEVWGRGRECGQHVLLGLSLHWPPSLPPAGG